MQVIQDVKPAFSGHADVQNDDIPVLAKHVVERFLCGSCFSEAYPGECFTKSFGEPSAKNCVVVSTQNSHDDSFCVNLDLGTGIRRSMVVPDPSTPSILSSP